MRQRIRKRPWMMPALLMVLVFALGLLLEAARPLGSSASTVGDRVVDPETAMNYEMSLGSSTSTRYSGRVWADKTVYQGDVDLEMSGEINDVIEIGDDDFLVGYSMLAASTVISGQSVVPLDVVFVIDLSLSMNEGSGKIEQTVVALNQAVKTLMNGHPDTRVAVVTYSDEAAVLLPLDHYSKVGSWDYFSLSEDETGKSLQTHVMNSQGTVVEASSKMNKWTNIHMGVDMGMDLLLAADTTTASGVARHPALMLMSDGAPTCAGNDENVWWDPQTVGVTHDTDKNGSFSLRTIMNAAYQKQRVTEHYRASGEDLEMQVYTVGVGVDNLNEVERIMAQVTLNPESGLQSQDIRAKQVKEAWESYLNQGTPTLGGYTFNHPESGDIQSVNYNDGYFYAEDAQGIANAFNQVLDQIIVTGAVPTEVGNDPANSGFITYTDPIGEYLEVKKVKALVWNGVIYRETDMTTIEQGNVTTYRYEGYMTSPVYGQHSLSEIQITVTTDPVTKHQTLEVKVPAALIPLRMNTVTLDDAGNATENVHYNDDPLRLFYTVGMREDVLTQERTVDLSKIDTAYIQDHRNDADGTVNFYANLYEGNTEDQAGVTKTVGNARVNFVPADTNPFYFTQSDLLLYADTGCTTPAQPGAATVYVKVPYYDGTTRTYDVVARSTAYRPQDIITGADGNLYLKAGSRCNLSDRIVDKGTEGNPTQTAETYHYPIYTTDGGGKVTGIQLYLGNNGRLQAESATGDLTVSKTVTGNMGQQDRAFVFDLTAYHTDGTGQAPLNGSYVAAKSPAEDAAASAPEPSLGPGESLLEFTAGKAQVTLRHGQSLTIRDLPAGYTYVVTEQDPNANAEGYVVTATQDGTAVAWEEGEPFSCTGTIQSGGTSQVAYVNKWYVPMVDYAFTKVDGLSFDSTDLSGLVTLSGAEFALYQYTGTDWDTDQSLPVSLEGETPVWTQRGGTVTSDDSGVVTFAQLPAGHYRLVETAAPEGYQLPDGQWNLTVAISGAENHEVGQFETTAVGRPPAMAVVNDTYYLMNYKPMEPPITGSDGGQNFRIGGGILMFTGAILTMWWLGSSPRKRSEFL